MGDAELYRLVRRTTEDVQEASKLLAVVTQRVDTLETLLARVEAVVATLDKHAAVSDVVRETVADNKKKLEGLMLSRAAIFAVCSVGAASASILVKLLA